MSVENLKKRLWLAAFALSLPLTPVHAAPVTVVDYALSLVSFDIFVTPTDGGPGGGTTHFVTGNPPNDITIDMGVYTDPYFAVPAAIGSATATFYSTGDFGDPVPTATVDAMTDTAVADFTGMYVDIAINPIFTFTTQLATDLVSGTYSEFGTADCPLSQCMWLMWMENFTFIDINGASWDVEMWVTMDGSVTVVPVPASVWLLGSGLLALVGAARRRA